MRRSPQHPCASRYYNNGQLSLLGVSGAGLLSRQRRFAPDAGFSRRFGVTLAASEADYLIVAGHYPIYSASRHGPTPYLIDQVKPLLEKYRATAYLSGHDHCEQYLQERVGDVDHHTVGSASINDPKLTHKDDVPPGSLKYFSAATLGGFASVTVTHEGLSLTHHDGDGKVLYVAPPHAPRDTQWLSGAADRLREVVDRE